MLTVFLVLFVCGVMVFRTPHVLLDYVRGALLNGLTSKKQKRRQERMIMACGSFFNAFDIQDDPGGLEESN